MKVTDAQSRMQSAYQLLLGDTFSVKTIEHIGVLLKGIHPEIDKKLSVCTKALNTLQKIQSGDMISLSVEHLPEGSKEEKKRKKLLIFFIESIKDLQSEIKRVEAELAHEQKDSFKSKASSWGRIIKFAKGPFGLVTLAAIIIVGAIYLNLSLKKPSPVIMIKQKIPVILFQGKQIPLSQLRVGHAHVPNCDAQHYHALNQQADTATAVDGTVLLDPGNCGFGKVNDTQVMQVYGQ